jgi:O-antigen/teichoic acid export membrane protein
MIRFGLPLFAGGLVASIVNQVRLILLPWFVSDVVIGNFQVANYFTMLIFSFTAALGVTLYPTFSKFSYTRDPEGTRQVYRMAVRYSTLLVISVTFLLISVAVPMIETLYGSRYPDAPGFFVLLALPGLLSGLGLYAFPAWLNSQGDTRCVFVIHVLQAGISLLLAPLGLMVFNMSGFLVSLIVSNSVATLYAVMTLRRRYGVPRIFSHTVRVFTIAGLAALASYGLLWALSGFTPVIRLIAGTILYCVLILVLAPVTRAIESRDVQALTTMFGTQRGIGPVVRLILGWEATLLHWLKR